MLLKIKKLHLPQVATNYVLLSGAEFISKILAAIAFAYLARILGPRSYGYLEFSIAIIFLFTLVVDSGLSSYGAREIAKQQSNYARLTIQITFARFLLACVAFIILAIITSFLNQARELKILLFLYSFTLLALPTLIQWVFQGRDLMSYLAVASIIRWSSFSVGVYLFVRGSGQILHIPIIEGVAILLSGSFLIGALAFNFGIPSYRINLGQAFSMIREALPIGASELVWAIKVYFATIFLGLVIGGTELGWFSAAHRIVISLHAFVWLYFYNLLPSISRTSQKPIEALQRLMSVSIPVTAWSAVFLGVFGTAFAAKGIELLYGSQYKEAASVFHVLVWLIPLSFLSGNYRYTLIGYNMQSLEFVSALVGAFINVILNVVLIRYYSFLGAAWALVLSEAVIGGLAYHFVHRKIALVPIWNQLQWPLLAGLVVIAAMHILLPLNLWLAGSLTALLYIVILFVSKPNLINDLISMTIHD